MSWFLSFPRSLLPVCDSKFVETHAAPTHHSREWQFAGTTVCVCLLLEDLLQSCSRGGREIVEDMCYESRRAVEGLYVQEGDLLEVPAKRRRSPRPATQNGAVLSASPPPTSQFNPGTVYPVWTILGLHRCVMKNKIKQLFLRSSSGRLGVPYPGRTELLQRHGAPKGRLTRTPHP